MSVFKDIQTGEHLTATTVAEINAAIVKIHADLLQGNKVFKEIQQAGASRELAEEASNAAAGGRFTQLYAILCNEHLLVSMQVKLPPAKDMEQVCMNEGKLSMLIYLIDPFMSLSRLHL